MNRKLIESTLPPTVKKDGKRMTVQVVEDNLVLNLYDDRQLRCRYVIDKEGKNYATLIEGKWGRRRLHCVASNETYYCSLYDVEKYKIDTKEQQQMLLSFWPNLNSAKEVYREISSFEDDINWDKSQRAYTNKVLRLEKMVNSIPMVPIEVNRWLRENVFPENYMFYDSETGAYSCTACGKKHYFKRKIKHNEQVECSRTETMVEVKKRNIKDRHREDDVTIIQKVPGLDRMVTKVMRANCNWIGCKKLVWLNAEILMIKDADNPKTTILYGQYREAREHAQSYWTSNQRSKRFRYKHLYVGNIREDVKGTCFEDAGYILEELQKHTWPINYSVVVDQYKWIGKLEYFVKAGLGEIVGDILRKYEYWSSWYYSSQTTYRMSAKTVDGFLKINMQRVHRLKQYKGGVQFLQWLQWEEDNNFTVKDTVLSFFDKHGISPKDYKFIKDRMSPQQFANYLNKQWMREHYQKEKLSVKDVVSDWKDYLNMSKNLGYSMTDEIVYKPTDLALRHAQRVQQGLERDCKKTCRDLKKKFKGVEPFLRSCKKKYEYEGEEYKVIVPSTILEIQMDGAHLKHCVASSERYYDRMNCKETFIAFVRKVDTPDIPFYTLEIEPGGNIRQQRTFFNRQTGLDEIKGFLGEYQREVKKRLTKKDMELAKESQRLHFANLKQLKASPVQRDKDLAEILETDYMKVG